MRSPLGIPCAMALIGSFLFAARAGAIAAPATPSFVMKWGELGTATSQFNNPIGVATDALGNVYVADTGNSRIQKFGLSGEFILQWGVPGSGDGQLNSPYAVALDGLGNVYVADTGNQRVEEFTSTGAYVRKWGSIGSGNGQFVTPAGVAVDPSGNVLVADYGNNRIQKFSGTGGYLAQWGTLGSGNGQLNGPVGVAVAPTGVVYVTDLNNNRVESFSGSGSYLGQWGSFGNVTGFFNAPWGVATDMVGNVFVVDSGNYRVQKFTATSDFVTSFVAPVIDFSNPFGIAIDPEGNLYVADYGNHRIVRYSEAGSPIAAAAPWPALQWSSGAIGIVVDAQGNLYATVPNNHRIEKYSSTGTLVASWGTAGTGNGQFLNPNGIATDAAGYVYVTDSGTNRVQKFTASGVYVTQWGSLGSGNGQFNAPQGIAVDPSGNVYVADSNNSRVQKFTGAGFYVGQWGTYGFGNGQFFHPFGITVDVRGDVYVTDNSGRLQRFNGAAAYLSQWPCTAFFLTTDAAGFIYVADFSYDRIRKFTSSGALVLEWGSAGSGSGQMDGPYGIALNAAGDVYVSEQNNVRVQRFVTAPQIGLVSDVGNDQGRQAQLRFFRSSGDATGSPITITGYEVYRRIDPLPAPARSSAAGPGLAGPASTALAGWNYVLTVPAHGENEYDVVVPTLTDATASSLNVSAFLARVATPNPLTFFDSAMQSGFSVDNLPPPTPSPFAAAYAAGVTHLHWGINTAADFATFHLHRGSSADFVPSASNLIAATPDTGYADPGPAGSYYKLAALDDDGNVSAFAVLGPGSTTAVEAPVVDVLRLEIPCPNPALARATIRFSLPETGRATVEILDLQGRRVRLLSDGLLAGGHRVETWDLRDDQDASVRPGLYFVRLRTSAETRSRRFEVIR